MDSLLTPTIRSIEIYNDMITLPDFSKKWDYENNYYLTCDAARFGKFIAHYELFKMTVGMPGAIVECGVFKGASLARWAGFRELFGDAKAQKVLAFDVFGEFPQTDFNADKGLRDRLITDAGSSSISRQQMMDVLRHKGVDENVECIEGDIVLTVPEYIREHPDLTISLLNLDTDIYEPAVVILEQLWPRIVPGGILILDDYGVFPGETKAVDEYFKGQSVDIKKFDYSETPCYIVKNK